MLPDRAEPPEEGWFDDIDRCDDDGGAVRVDVCGADRVDDGAAMRVDCDCDCGDGRVDVCGATLADVCGAGRVADDEISGRVDGRFEVCGAGRFDCGEVMRVVEVEPDVVDDCRVDGRSGAA